MPARAIQIRDPLVRETLEAARDLLTHAASLLHALDGRRPAHREEAERLFGQVADLLGNLRARIGLADVDYQGRYFDGEIWRLATGCQLLGGRVREDLLLDDFDGVDAQRVRADCALEQWALLGTHVEEFAWREDTVGQNEHGYPARPSSPLFPLTDALRQAILALARQSDIQSISCPFDDFHLWKGLLHEQVRRSRQTGRSPREALQLTGPDSGIPGVVPFYDDDAGTPFPLGPDPVTELVAPADQWGGEVHIPFEGTHMADLFILPTWRNVWPERMKKPGARLSQLVAAYGERCKYVLTNQSPHGGVLALHGRGAALS